MNRFQPVFDKQKAYFNTDATKSYEWWMDQLHRIANMLKENAEAFQEAVSKDFKTALAEKVFEVAAPLATIEFTQSQLHEWMKSVPAPVPKALAASGHAAVVIREPYGVSLIIGPSNGPLIITGDIYDGSVEGHNETRNVAGDNHLPCGTGCQPRQVGADLEAGGRAAFWTHSHPG